MACCKESTHSITDFIVKLFCKESVERLGLKDVRTNCNEHAKVLLCARLQVKKNGGICVDRLNKKDFELFMLFKCPWQAATF